MGKQACAPSRDELLRRMYRLATGKANDAVKLAFLTQEEAGRIGRLDLDVLQEFKRSPAGAIEVRLIDRVGVLEKLLQATGGEDRMSGMGFLKALEEIGREDA